MNITDQIRKLRDTGVIHCDYLEKSATLMEVAQAFSLNDDNANYRTIAKSEAVQILTRLLHKDLAYNQKIMPLDTAQQLSELFLADFDASKTSFYTNIDFGTERQIGPDSWAGPRWKPVTNSTFDAGVIAITPQRAACLWVEDED